MITLPTSSLTKDVHKNLTGNLIKLDNKPEISRTLTSVMNRSPRRRKSTQINDWPA